tara:strand:+ start:612 stop:1517 length:906 start_codon:yes stop_codon:yes gene_type:complete
METDVKRNQFFTYITRRSMNLVTVCGHNTTMLYHMLRHYQPNVKNFFVNIYANYEDDPIIEEATSICRELGIEPHKVWIEEPFNWDKVTEIYNETISLKPDEWWVVADDDELQVYSKPIEEIVEECEENGWEFVRGGFIDRIGEGGDFPKITKESNVWKEMPNAGFFRYPLSRAEANKVTLLKGKHGVVSGQHFIQFDNGDTSWGDYHPLCYPIEKNFTQVHHFKWDYSVLQRLKEVSSSKLHEAFSHEYKKMLSAIEYLDYKLDLNEREFMFERVESPDYKQYRKWKPLTKKILKIGGLI